MVVGPSIAIVHTSVLSFRFIAAHSCFADHWFSVLQGEKGYLTSRPLVQCFTRREGLSDEQTIGSVCYKERRVI